MNDPRLNPCLRCRKKHNNNGVLTLFKSTDSDAGGYYPANVHCSRCGSRVVGDLTDESAIKFWNEANPRKRCRS